MALKISDILALTEVLFSSEMCTSYTILQLHWQKTITGNLQYNINACIECLDFYFQHNNILWAAV